MSGDGGLLVLAIRADSDAPYRDLAWKAMSLPEGGTFDTLLYETVFVDPAVLLDPPRAGREVLLCALYRSAHEREPWSERDADTWPADGTVPAGWGTIPLRYGTLLAPDPRRPSGKSSRQHAFDVSVGRTPALGSREAVGGWGTLRHSLRRRDHRHDESDELDLERRHGVDHPILVGVAQNTSLLPRPKPVPEGLSARGRALLETQAWEQHMRTVSAALRPPDVPATLHGSVRVIGVDRIGANSKREDVVRRPGQPLLLARRTSYDVLLRTRLTGSLAAAGTSFADVHASVPPRVGRVDRPHKRVGAGTIEQRLGLDTSDRRATGSLEIEVEVPRADGSPAGRALLDLPLRVHGWPSPTTVAAFSLLFAGTLGTVLSYVFAEVLIRSATDVHPHARLAGHDLSNVLGLLGALALAVGAALLAFESQRHGRPAAG